MRRRLPTRAGFAVWRDGARLRVEEKLSRPITKGFVRLYHERHLHPKNFVTGTAADPRRASWLGVPTWKLPSDMWTYQEILFETRPDLVIETGTQYGGSALYFASMFDLIGAGEVITVDIDTTAVHERVREHPRVTVLESSSTAPELVATLTERAAGRRVMVVLDSDHQREHVANEIRLLSGLVAPGCYLVVEDTALGTTYLPGWGGSQAALNEWVPHHPEFELDRTREKFLATVNPGGYLRRVA
jgi:cephalosporin hydroxylase